MIYAISSHSSGLKVHEITSSTEIGKLLSGDKPIEAPAAPQIQPNNNNTPKIFQSTLQDTTRFSDFDRDLEDQISQLKLDDMNMTQHTHYSQYSDAPSQLKPQEQEQLEDDILKEFADGYEKQEQEKDVLDEMYSK